MGHDIAIQSQYFIAAFCLFTGIPVLFPGVFRNTVRLITPYLLSFSPAALLCCLLYLVYRVSAV